LGLIEEVIGLIEEVLNTLKDEFSTKGAKMVEKINIRMDLQGDMANYFILLKKRKGIKNNTELVRILIVQEYDRLMGRQIA